MKKGKLAAEKRKITGRKVKSLRREKIIPANIFGKKIKSEAIQIKLTDFESVYRECGETKVVEISLGGKLKPVLIHGVQKDPVTDGYLHVDFLQVDLKQKVTAYVPIELVNESPAEKQGFGTVVQHIGEIEVEALPTEIPENFQVDLAALKVADDNVKVKDLKTDIKKVKILEDEEQIIVKVEPIKVEEEKKEEVKEEEEKEEDKEKKEEVKEEEEKEEDKEKKETS